MTWRSLRRNSPLESRAVPTRLMCWRATHELDSAYKTKAGPQSGSFERTDLLDGAEHSLAGFFVLLLFVARAWHGNLQSLFYRTHVVNRNPFQLFACEVFFHVHAIFRGQ